MVKTLEGSDISNLLKGDFLRILSALVPLLGTSGSKLPSVTPSTTCSCCNPPLPPHWPKQFFEQLFTGTSHVHSYQLWNSGIRLISPKPNTNNLYTNLSLSLCLSLSLSVSLCLPPSLSLSLSLSLSVSLSVCLCLSVSVCLSVSLPPSLSTYPSIHPSIYPSIYPCTCVFVCLQ